jgi:small subunit ribosomal protein S35
MGETHPAEKKIVVEFCTRDLPGLTDAQRIKLIKLVGPRYNPETDIVKMSCEMFETQAQNKRYLGDLVDTLMVEAKDESDKFEDVPLDFRHHKYKKKIQFPEAWVQTPERTRKLKAIRRRTSEKESARELKGHVVDGVEVIENWLKKSAPKEPNPLLVEERPGKGRPLGRQGAQQKSRFRR